MLVRERRFLEFLWLEVVSCLSDRERKSNQMTDTFTETDALTPLVNECLCPKCFCLQKGFGCSPGQCKQGSIETIGQKRVKEE